MSIDDCQTHKDCLSLSKVGFSYGGQKVLENITFSLPKGDYVGIVGPNGSGKTTLLKLLLGLLKPDTGRILVFGHSVTKAKEHADIGYVPQKVAEEAVNFPATVREIIASGGNKTVEQAIEVTGIAPLLDRLIGDLSGGERQRVFIARALTSKPKILILDEPTTGVDAANRARFFDFLKKLNEEWQMTILLVTHDLGVVAREVKTVLCLNRTLHCNVGVEEFVKGDYLKKIYGEGYNVVRHDH